ncbi:uncharacterized protein CC84DRAFT_825889 [Paraphaeosphaeria sporulosa]|uniref:Uncharacterized protein n=1 Tax=Paraphaeosphaeria sporulosa TaxID=1460663 RepID=A0A177CEA9_9PLEO|nr:uncharacterized protein CC84DRAFT_825889 [Paraphaeosphaeria sporulosa]OAG05070.1 hypothetical protein CC84DRAFT_825889 [Paraphaeosphaeria sporulosa]
MNPLMGLSITTLRIMTARAKLCVRLGWAWHGIRLAFLTTRLAVAQFTAVYAIGIAGASPTATTAESHGLETASGEETSHAAALPGLWVELRFDKGFFGIVHYNQQHQPFATYHPCCICTRKIASQVLHAESSRDGSFAGSLREAHGIPLLGRYTSASNANASSRVLTLLVCFQSSFRTLFTFQKNS